MYLCSNLLKVTDLHLAESVWRTRCLLKENSQRNRQYGQRVLFDLLQPAVEEETGIGIAYVWPRLDHVLVG
jgi:hypothetical protein